MLQDIPRFRRKASDFYYANYPTQLHFAWRGTHCRSPVVTMLSFVAHRALMMPIHRLSAHSTCRKLHVWFNCTQPSVLQRLLFAVCCCSSAVQCVMTVPTAWWVAGPCHVVYGEYIPVNVQCRLYNFTAARDGVTQAANTHLA